MSRRPPIANGSKSRSLVTASVSRRGARPLFKRALAIYEKVLGSEHPSTATSLNNLASLLQAQGDLAGARPLNERALAIREKALGAEHPGTAESPNNLANLLHDHCGRKDMRSSCSSASSAYAIFRRHWTKPYSSSPCIKGI
jgi:tetratricopeptide (TPR) repeat protein